MSNAALVQSATRVDGSAVAADTIDVALTGVAANNCLISSGAVYCQNSSFVISSVADGGDSFTTRQGGDTGDVSGEAFGWVSHAVGVSSGNKTVTLTTTGRGADPIYYSAGLSEWSGVFTSAAEDDWDANNDIDLTATDVSAGGAGFTTTQSDTLIVGTASINSSSTNLNFSSPPSWTNLYRQNDSSATVGHDFGYWRPDAVQTDYLAQWAHDNIAGNVGGGVVVALKCGTYTAPRIIHQITNRQMAR